EEDEEKSIAAYERGLELHPNDPDLSRALAARYREAERMEDARKVLTRALQGSPSDPGLMVSLAESIDDKKEAMQLARKAALRAPASGAAWSYLLEICQKNGKEAEAVTAARELIELRPHDVNAHLRLAEMLHREDQWEESLTVIADAMAIDRRQADAHFLFATRLFQRKYYEKALAACSPPEVDPSDLHALNVFSARIMHAMGDHALACQKLRKALQRDPTDLESWIRLADWAEHANDYKLYDESSTALIHRGAHLPVAHGYYATTLVRQNRRERAAEHLQYALELDHKYEFALREFLVLMINQHKTTEAEAFLDKIAERIPVRMLAIGRLMIAAATDDMQDFLITLECIPDDEEQEEIAAIACQYMSPDRFATFGIALNKAIKRRKANKAVGYAWAHFYAGGEQFEFGMNQFLKLRRSNASITAATYFLNVLRVSSADVEPETLDYLRSKTQAVMKRLGRYVYRDPALWSVVLWTLINQDQLRKAIAVAKRFAKVKDRDVEQTVPAILAAIYGQDLKLVAKLLDDAEAMDPEKMTEECRMLRAMYTVFEGTDAELEKASRMVNKNDLEGAFLRASKLITAGLKSIEDKDPAALIKIWKIEFFRKNHDGDPLDLRIYQLLRSRIAKACGEKREARKWYKGKFKE
ncbi:MAG: hypothetical protein AAF745_15870, partial [Planctomycetota bacterium]